MRRAATSAITACQASVKPRPCHPPTVLRAGQSIPALALAALGCLGLTPPPDGPLSYGATNRGILRNGVPLADAGEGYVRARPGESTRYGTRRLVEVLQRGFADVARRFPGTAPMRVGDLSAPVGGRHHRHGSHRSGRDADVLFYMTDPSGRSRTGRGWLAYNRFGFAVEHGREGSGSSGGLFLFDDTRNWHFVRTLLLDEEGAVQWLFVSRGVKARLLRHAIAHEPDPQVITRAAYALHQPLRASPHDDHFHVRILCTEDEVPLGCRERGPIWPWLRPREKGRTPVGEPLDDDALLRLVLEPLEDQADEDAGDERRGPT